MWIFAFTVSGKVVSEGKPIEGAIVFVREVGVRAYTDKDGKFSLNLKGGEYTFVVQALGYRVERERFGISFRYHDKFLFKTP
jgi:hypothetical protein